MEYLLDLKVKLDRELSDDEIDMFLTVVQSMVEIQMNIDLIQLDMNLSTITYEDAGVLQ